MKRKNSKIFSRIFVTSLVAGVFLVPFLLFGGSPPSEAEKQEHVTLPKDVFLSLRESSLESYYARVSYKDSLVNITTSYLAYFGKYIPASEESEMTTLLALLEITEAESWKRYKESVLMTSKSVPLTAKEKTLITKIESSLRALKEGK